MMTELTWREADVRLLEWEFKHIHPRPAVQCVNDEGMRGMMKKKKKITWRICFTMATYRAFQIALKETASPLIATLISLQRAAAGSHATQWVSVACVEYSPTSCCIIVPTGRPLISRILSPTWMAFRTSGLMSIPLTLQEHGIDIQIWVLTF